MALRLCAAGLCLTVGSSSSLRENTTLPKSLTHSRCLSPTAGWLHAGPGFGQELRSLGELLLALLLVFHLTALLQFLPSACQCSPM